MLSIYFSNYYYESKAQTIKEEQQTILAGLTGKTSIKQHQPLNDRYSLKNRTIARDFLGEWVKKAGL
jgi:hypothetical protein